MRPAQLKYARSQSGLTQKQAAGELGVSQAYLSLLERGDRAITPELAQRAALLWNLAPTALPLPDSVLERPVCDGARLARQVAALGYPGFAHLPRRVLVNPAVVLWVALCQQDLEVRLSEALPWVALYHVELDWGWLVQQAKLQDVQNRLGFVVGLASELAERNGRTEALEALRTINKRLEPSRLAREDTLCRESMPRAERQWLSTSRSELARHWNILSGLSVEQLSL